MSEETVIETTEETTMADLEDHFDDANPWNRVAKYQADKTPIHVTVSGVVTGGVIAVVEGLRGFIPASKVSLSYVEDLETLLNQELDVQVIDCDPDNNRLVLSARELLRQEERRKQAEKVAQVEVGSVLHGTVENIQPYGAFVRLEDGLSGLVHISQVSNKRLESLKGVLNEGDEVDVKVIGVRDGKISLSIKALSDSGRKSGDSAPRGGRSERVKIPKAEKIGTSLGDLMKDIKL